MYILDTDHLSVIERGEKTAEKLLTRLDEFAVQAITATVISYEEQTRGWLAQIARAQTIEMQVRQYRFLNKHLDNFCKFLVLDYDQQAAAIFQRLKQERIRIGTMDLRIASIVLSNDAILLTRNLSDFNRVPNLRAENWID